MYFDFDKNCSVNIPVMLLETLSYSHVLPVSLQMLSSKLRIIKISNSFISFFMTDYCCCY